MQQPDSFLPSEYVEQRRDHRTTILAIGLFLVIVGTILAAFLHRQSQLDQIVNAQKQVIKRTEDAAIQVAMLTSLQQSRVQMLERAELAAALVERVPRSILMAELINRMPNGLGLTEFNLESKRLRTAPAPAAQTGGRRSARTAPSPDAKPAVEVPRYVVRMEMKGVAPTDLHVSKFLSSLNDYPLLQDVRLESTQEDLVDDDMVRRFEITCALRPEADVRNSADPSGTSNEMLKRLNRNEVSW
tara:strand:+ start:4550 stop:5281 length:732 start_codon:yes stop_codon:yes gene_type:complete